jgi:hypothetical protein
VGTFLHTKTPAGTLLRELRELHAAIRKTREEEVWVNLTNQFVTKFQELDGVLSGGGTFPFQWITTQNQQQLKPGQYALDADKTEVPKQPKRPKSDTRKKWTPKLSSLVDFDDSTPAPNGEDGAEI